MATFDPVAILAALERHRVGYVVVGELAGVIHGSGMTTRTVEITPSLKPENLERCAAAVADLGASRPQIKSLADLRADSDALAISTDRGAIRITPTPAGTRGFDDLRRAAQREPLGRGVRAAVVSLPDLIRTIDVGARAELAPLEQRLRRAAELDRILTPDI